MLLPLFLAPMKTVFDLDKVICNIIVPYTPVINGYEVAHNVIPNAGDIDKSLGVALVGLKLTKVEKACMCFSWYYLHLMQHIFMETNILLSERTIYMGYTWHTIGEVMEDYQMVFFITSFCVTICSRMSSREFKDTIFIVISLNFLTIFLLTTRIDLDMFVVQEIM
jgi:hypothetical protein